MQGSRCNLHSETRENGVTVGLNANGSWSCPHRKMKWEILVIDRETSWLTSELIERGIGHLAFPTFLGVSRKGVLDDNLDILRHLQLLVRVKSAESRGFGLVCSLLWKGGISKDILLRIQTQTLDLVWETLVAWKALGWTWALSTAAS